MMTSPRAGIVISATANVPVSSARGILDAGFIDLLLHAVPRHVRDWLTALPRPPPEVVKDR
jgi:hypothetical protein